MAREAIIPFLVTMMLVTGVCNTILNKYQDMQCVRNCDSLNPADHKLFEQPVIQTAQMFVGELGCFLVVLLSYLYTRFVASRTSSTAPLFAGGYRRIREDDHIPEYHDGEEEAEEYAEGVETNPNVVNNHPSDPTITKPIDETDAGGRRILNGWRILMLAAPACCDILGTTMMNAGLLFVAASIYQMTRGALVLFVGLFSVLFLRRRLYMYQWFALVIVVLGVGIVGLSGALFGHDQGVHDPESGISNAMSRFARDVNTTARTPEAVRVIIGVLLIAAAQIFTATQFVLEEWILEHYAMDPLNVVGWEGFFGLLVTTIGMVILHLAIGSTDAGRYGYFDLKEGWRQITHNRAIAVSSFLIMISIGGFNFFGLSVTRTVSATSRSTIDTSRTLFIWLVSLGLGWESFKWLQVLGFALLVYGTFLFNDIIRAPLKACLPARREFEHEELLPEEPIEHI
ncbi:nucleotide-sugar transporter, putative [Talaromyces stipitatus ATCC 10500]|uniref:Nucleotide-sugar transporter, putative n=1 Tax=Talaromyces stipitatus (strain ATCC 10500 / CBS 375.48 / QM 6759 / NRRL 1006) TaxID=441959 RepID=B8M841_TALSN|nr:nucleotide-sugar transporter, putative [Talaromyces stipitatus ATCC 10500]EED20003.1 nucleotide-sugar transporter, putative [Talaromyces stipitatus ATCC 10500]